jgi:hypothetical protein
MRLRSRFAPGYEIWGRFHLYEPLVGLAVGPSGALSDGTPYGSSSSSQGRR